MDKQNLASNTTTTNTIRRGQSRRSFHKAVKIKSLLAFIEKVQEKKIGKITLYRGLNQDFQLVPKIGRKFFQGDKKYNKFEENERQLFEEFRRLSPPYLTYHPKNDWELLSIGQHYGLPTRLLDWTTNPLIALFFALDGYKEKAKPPIVWEFKPTQADFVNEADYNKSPFEIKRTKVFPPPIVNERLRSQSGWFSVHKFLSDEIGRDWFVPLEQQPQYSGRLTKYEFELDTKMENHIERYRFLLNQLGINSSSVYPDLGGLSRHLEWENFPTEFEI